MVNTKASQIKKWLMTPVPIVATVPLLGLIVLLWRKNKKGNL